MRIVLKFTNVVLWISTFVVACLWAHHPGNSHYEPITAILGLISGAITAALAWKPTAYWIREKQRTVQMPSTAGENLPHDHKEVLRKLNDNNVEYLVIGGFTGLFYGGVCHTHDLDLWIGHEADNHQRLKEAIEQLGWDPSMIGGTDPVSHAFFRLGEAPIDLYLSKSMNRTDFYDFYGRRKVFVIDDLPISVMSQKDNRVQTSYKFDPPKLEKK